MTAPWYKWLVMLSLVRELLLCSDNNPLVRCSCLVHIPLRKVNLILAFLLLLMKLEEVSQPSQRKKIPPPKMFTDKYSPYI